MSAGDGEAGRRAEVVENDRQARAVELAVAAARKESRVDQILEDHSRDLNRLGDLLRANTTELQGVGAGQEAIRALVDGVRADLKTRDAVNLALIDAGKSKGEKKLTRFQTLALAIGVVISVGSFLLTIVQAVHG